MIKGKNGVGRTKKDDDMAGWLKEGVRYRLKADGKKYVGVFICYDSVKKEFVFRMDDGGYLMLSGSFAAEVLE